MRGRGKYICRECGYESVGWLGRCPGCGAWNTLIAEVLPSEEEGRKGVSSPPPVPIGSIIPPTEGRLESA
ncbi:MAG: DNA repair protein RadA, partial [Firmicutes bacterium]|nr:DNA repair protein RadA [Bacillota bacterium]